MENIYSELADPHKLAASLIEQNGIKSSYDGTAESHNRVTSLIDEALGKLSCAELGQLICTDQDDANAEEFVYDLHRLPESTNFRGFLEHTANYIVDMVMHAQIERTSPSK